VTYTPAEKSGVTVHFSDGTSESFDVPKLDTATSERVFQRTGEIKQLTVSVKSGALR
jgi:hypothetical protein